MDRYSILKAQEQNNLTQTAVFLSELFDFAKNK